MGSHREGEGERREEAVGLYIPLDINSARENQTLTDVCKGTDDMPASWND
jgi:hypothetical protein